ncbi:MAG TPA: RDD family protein [Steroidobacteraceae bacterium]
MISTIDTVITAETPEGIAISMRAAGFPVRCMAFLIDALIRYMIVSGVAATLGPGGRVGTGVLLIIVFLILWLYPIIFELTPAAATPGKRAMGIQVMMANGLPLTPAGSLIRNLMRAVDMLPLLYGFAIVSVLMRRDARRLGDLAAGTIVVYRDRTSPTSDFGPGEPLPPPMPLNIRQQTAIAAFGWRVNRLTPERAEEIAVLAAAAVPGAKDSAVTARLVGIARWQHGQRRFIPRDPAEQT